MISIKEQFYSPLSLDRHSQELFPLNEKTKLMKIKVAKWSSERLRANEK